VISLQKNFLFVHVLKTGGNSLSSALLRWSEDELVTDERHHDGVEDFGINNPGYGTYKHSTLAEYRAALPEHLYAGLFKFSVLRNPWDRMISAYFAPHRVFYLKSPGGWNRDDFLELLESGRLLTKPMRHFITSRPSSEGAALDSELDFLLRYENLEADFAELCDRIEVPRVALPRVNASERKPYTHYYDAELREIVGQRYAEEIAFGGYEFGADWRPVKC